jgi:hypothetical protein
MPGDLPAGQDMHNYLVSLHEPTGTGPEGQGRASVVDRNLARTTRFREDLQQLLRSQGLIDQVASLGEPMAFPALAIRCTQAVADFVANLPEVDAVIRDNGRNENSGWAL